MSSSSARGERRPCPRIFRCHTAPSPDPTPTDATDEGARELAALGLAPIPPDERERVNEPVRKAVQGGVYRVQRPANDTGEP